MDYSSSAKIIQLATEAVHEVAGTEVTVEIEYEAGVDSTEQPAYFFFIRLLKDPSYNVDPTLVRIRLPQHIIDKLLASGDTHFPYIRKLTILDAQPSIA